MTTDLVVQPTEIGLTLSEDEVDGIQELVNAAFSRSTRRAYAADFRKFTAWCAQRRSPVAPLPLDPLIVAAYLHDLFSRTGGAYVKVHTIARALTGIISIHRLKGYSWSMPEALKQEMKGIRRERAAMGEKITQKEAITKDILLQILAPLEMDLRGLRNRALLTLTWWGCSRRSEITELDVTDLTFKSDGLLFQPKKTKTDQEGKDTSKAVLFKEPEMVCAVRSVRAWLDAANITTGPVFRPITAEGVVRPMRLSTQAVAHIVKKALKAAGIDPTTFSAHSLRSGFITEAALRRVPEYEIAEQSGHKSTVVLRGYVRKATKFSRNAGRDL